jgi:hypothetical protein
MYKSIHAYIYVYIYTCICMQDLAERIHEAQINLKAQASQRVSKYGCVRADGIKKKTGTGPRGPRVTRILSKAVGDEFGRGKSEGETEVCMYTLICFIY